MTTYISSLAKSYSANYSGLSRLCWIGIGINFFESTLIGIYWFLPLYFITTLHFSIATAGFAISMYGIGTMCGGYLGGKCSDNYSPEAVQACSLFIQGFVFLALMQFQQIYPLLIALFFMGLASYSFITSNQLWILANCGHDENLRLKAINLLSSAANLGLSISAIIIGSFAIYGFKNIFTISCLLIFTCAVYCLKIYKSSNYSIKKLAGSYIVVNNVNSLVKKSTIYLTLTCLFLAGFIIFQTSTTYTVYIQEKFPEYGIKGISNLFLINTLLVVMLQAPIVSFFHRVNKIVLMGIGGFLLGFGMMMLPFISSFLFAALACVLYTIGEMLFFAVAQLLCYQSGDENKKGGVMGLYRVIYASSRVAAPAVGSFVFQQFGGDILWYSCGMIGLTMLAGTAALNLITIRTRKIQQDA